MQFKRRSNEGTFPRQEKGWIQSLSSLLRTRKALLMFLPRVRTDVRSCHSFSLSNWVVISQDAQFCGWQALSQIEKTLWYLTKATLLLTFANHLWAKCNKSVICICVLNKITQWGCPDIRKGLQTKNLFFGFWKKMFHNKIKRSLCLIFACLVQTYAQEVSLVN